MMLLDLRRRSASASAGQPDEEFSCYFLHHAGGSASGFLQVQRFFPADWRLRAVEFPGRGLIPGTQPYRSSTEAVAALAPAIAQEANGPYALFGHSMGALVAYELAREMEGRGKAPIWLGVSSMAAPQVLRGAVRERRDLWPQERLVAYLRNMGGTPEELLQDAEMMAHMVRILRWDLRIVDTYRHVPGPPLRVPLSVFMGEQDPLTPWNRVEGWRNESGRTVEFHSLPGGHFHLFEEPERFARSVTAGVHSAERAIPDGRAQGRLHHDR